MPNIQLKNVPDDVHRTLRARAGAAGQSLQEYLLGKLTAQARRPTVDEILARAGERSGGSLPLTTAAELIRTDRDAR
ncbi:MAG: FitA-like ribbon-helix-helix domain-containing protein [Mycobacteriales bacterium]